MPLGGSQDLELVISPQWLSPDPSENHCGTSPEPVPGIRAESQAHAEATDEIGLGFHNLVNFYRRRTTMHRIIGITFWLIIASTLIWAQTTNESRGHGYAFVAPGAVSGNGTTATLQFGLGGEGLITRRFGVGAEIGYLAPAKRLRNGFGVFSPNVSYHFINPSSAQKVVPFVTAGYSLGFSSGVTSGFNFGGASTTGCASGWVCAWNSVITCLSRPELASSMVSASGWPFDKANLKSL